MISWMQKHRKWLVITIWISTIAFVGAGFVGWGSYSYNKSGNTVATVGELEVTTEDLQKEYNTLYGQYEKMFGGQFNQETAEKLGLQNQALTSLTQKYLFLNLANKYGIRATNEDVAKELLKYDAFFKDGKFDKNTYIQVLQQNRTNPTDFENSLKKDITFMKTIMIFSGGLSKKEADTMSKIFFAQDEVSIAIIDGSKAPLSVDLEALRKYWEKNKSNYKTTQTYTLNIEKMPLGADPKQSKNDALKKYLDLKNKKTSFALQEIIDDKNEKYKTELPAILALKEGEISKPILIGDQYTIIQMGTKNPPKELPFDAALPFVKKDFEKTLVGSYLEQEKEKLMKNFSGTNIGFISKETPPTIASLSKEESEKLAQDISISRSVIGSSSIGNKVVVFKIESSQLGTPTTEANQYLSQSIEKMKNEAILMGLLEKLQKEYETKSYMKASQK